MPESSSPRISLEPTTLEVAPRTRPPSSRRPDWGDTGGSYGPTADPFIGFVVGERYRMIERLGKGGMGMVYKVQHVHLGKVLALKLLASELTNEQSASRRFVREANLASRLSHPNTVHVFDFGVTDGLTWLVMELVPGEDLSKILRREGPLEFGRAIVLMAQVCSSLAEAHSLGIVHRDIKPANLMVSRSREGDEVVKVLDFGLAKLRESAELNEVSSQGAILGTPYYMAPEQIGAGPVDERADVYAMGAVLYRLVTGEPVFDGDNPAQIFVGHLQEQPVPPHERAPEQHIPLALSRVVMKALSKRPEDRFQSALELRAALLDVATQEPTGLAPERLSALATPSVPILPVGHATRDELEAYERKLRRMRWLSRLVWAGLALIAAYGGSVAYRSTSATRFDGNEHEPNDKARDAGDVPFGRPVTGYIGKRIDTEHPDVDMHRISIPTGSGAVSIRATALPNMAMCTLVYPSGEEQPLARLCTGRPRVELSAPAYRLAPGTYLFAITQDRSPHGTRGLADVVENVSDAYHLTVERAHDDPTSEVEPNDTARDAEALDAGESRRGSLAWVGDVDMLCAKPGAAGRWVISVSNPTAGSVLEVAAPDGKPLARVHALAAPAAHAGIDVVTPYKGPQVSEATRCLRLRRARDPWLGDAAPLEPPVGPDGWQAQIER